MMHRRAIWRSALGFAAAVVAGCAPADKGNINLAQRLDLIDVRSGATVDVSASAHTPTALIFIAPDCPISNIYAPEINAIVREYQPRGVSFLLVHAGAGADDTRIEHLKTHAHEYGFAVPVCLDRTNDLHEHLGVTVTPEVAVVAHQCVQYRGRIDDRFIDFGKRRLQPSQRDLRAALDAILRGEPVANPRTRAVGCYIPEANR